MNSKHGMASLSLIIVFMFRVYPHRNLTEAFKGHLRSIHDLSRRVSWVSVRLAEVSRLFELRD